jgi:CBS domain-containing protein
MSDDTMSSFVKGKISMVELNTPVMEIFNLMKKKSIRHVPVVNDGLAIGIISDRDVQFINHIGDALQLTAKDIMTDNPYSVDSMTSIPHVVNVMAKKKISSVLIHDSEKKISGIFTSTDALEILASTYKI